MWNRTIVISTHQKKYLLHVDTLPQFTQLDFQPLDTNPLCFQTRLWNPHFFKTHPCVV